MYMEYNKIQINTPFVHSRNVVRVQYNARPENYPIFQPTILGVNTIIHGVGCMKGASPGLTTISLLDGVIVGLSRVSHTTHVPTQFTMISGVRN